MEAKKSIRFQVCARNAWNEPNDRAADTENKFLWLKVATVSAVSDAFIAPKIGCNFSRPTFSVRRSIISACACCVCVCVLRGNFIFSFDAICIVPTNTKAPLSTSIWPLSNGKLIRKQCNKFDTVHKNSARLRKHSVVYVSRMQN